MDVVDEVKRRIDTVEFIGRSVRLQKSGRNFRGLCPFHAERTPSFYVFPDRGTWRCFGSCGEGGDIFTFVQKQENLDFRGALRELAREAGVQLSPEGAQRRERQERLASVVSAAVDFYERMLAGADGTPAREYLQATRGIEPDTAAAFHLGWAPDAWRSLRDYLVGRGYSEHEGVDAGLLIAPESGGQPYDRFRGRIVIPIADERGVFVGFGGRGLHGEEPKYLNSPQTDLFDKGRTLFGLHLAGQPARESGTIVVVEGYMDVVGPWQAGFRNVVATMGTSLTEHHAALLRRFARRVVLAMDPDAAGLAAAERAGSLFIGARDPEALARSARAADALSAASELEIRVAPLPAGQDPDEIARDDPDGWERAIAGAMPFAEFLLHRLMGDTVPESPVEARRMVDRLRPVLLAVRDPVERAVYVQRVARHLGVAESAIQERLRPRSWTGRPLAARRGPDEVPRSYSREEILLAIVLRYPSLRHHLRSLPADLFADALNREIFQRWMAEEDVFAVAEDDPMAAQVERVQGVLLAPLGPDDARRAAGQNVREILRDRLIQRQVAVTEDLADAERTLGVNRVAEVSNEAWRGGLLDDETAQLAQTAIEELELGRSIHRREASELS